MVEVPRPDFCLTSRSRNRRSSVSRIIANHLPGPRIRAALSLTGGSKSSTDGLGHFSALTIWRVCHGFQVARMVIIICGPDCFLHSPRSICTSRPGEVKSSPERGSLVAFWRTNRTSGRSVNDLRAYEDPQITNLGVGRSNRSGRANLRQSTPQRPHGVHSRAVILHAFVKRHRARLLNRVNGELGRSGFASIRPAALQRRE
jgi:hypothetical protein